MVENGCKSRSSPLVVLCYILLVLLLTPRLRRQRLEIKDKNHQCNDSFPARNDDFLVAISSLITAERMFFPNSISSFLYDSRAFALNALLTLPKTTQPALLWLRTHRTSISKSYVTITVRSLSNKKSNTRDALSLSMPLPSCISTSSLCAIGARACEMQTRDWLNFEFHHV